MAKKPSPIRSLFMSRKAKDKQGIKDSMEGGGDYTIKSNMKVTNPVRQGTHLPKGSVVSTSKSSNEIITKKTSPTTYRETEIDVPKTTYQPGDMQGKKIYDRPTTSALGNYLKENPAKTETRKSAQFRGEKSYDAGGGKMEYSGRDIISSEKKKISLPVPGKDTYKTETVKNSNTTVDLPEPTPKKGKSGGISMSIRRVAGENKQSKGQNYKRIDLNVGKKSVPIIQYRTKTKGSFR